MNLRRTIGLFLISTVGLLGCTQKIEQKPVRPIDLISRDSMIDILTDFEIYDALMMTIQKKDRIHYEYDKLYYYNSILEKYNITNDRFQQSYTYYEEDENQLDAIYDDVLTKLSKMKAETEAGKD